MTRHYKLFLIIGLIIFLLPFIGIPQSFRSVILFISGGILIIISLVYRAILKGVFNGDAEEVFVDSTDEILEDEKDVDEINELNSSEVLIAKSFPEDSEEDIETSFEDIEEEEEEFEKKITRKRGRPKKIKTDQDVENEE